MCFCKAQNPLQIQEFVCTGSLDQSRRDSSKSGERDKTQFLKLWSVWSRLGSYFKPPYPFPGWLWLELQAGRHLDKGLTGNRLPSTHQIFGTCRNLGGQKQLQDMAQMVSNFRATCGGKIRWKLCADVGPTAHSHNLPASLWSEKPDKTPLSPEGNSGS